MGRVEFVGFEEPQLDPNAPTWDGRIKALAEGYPREWAKYGPFRTRSAALNKASALRTRFYRQSRYKDEWRIDIEVSPGPADSEAFIFIRMWPRVIEEDEDDRP